MKNKELMEAIRKIFDKHKSRYGVRRIHHELLNMGFKVNHKKVQRLMKKMDLKGKRPNFVCRKMQVIYGSISTKWKNHTIVAIF